MPDDAEPVIIEPDESDVLSAIDAELAARKLATTTLLDHILLFHRDYLDGWVHRRLCHLLDQFLQAVEQKASPRLVISFPPRAGKSLIASENFPAYILGRHPEYEVVCATYGQDLADEFGRKVRNRLNDPIYLDLFPNVKLDARTNAVDRVKTTMGGGYMAVGMGGRLTGTGATIAIVDDPVKSREEADSQLQRERAWDWYSSVLRTRLAPGGGIIVIATRWHPDDLIGRLLKQAKENPDADQWITYSFPAIAEEDELYRKKGEALHPERYPIRELRKLEASLPPRDWCALYQCRPFVETGNFFRAETFRTYQSLPDLDLRWIVCADYAVSTKATADRSAIGALGLTHTKDVYLHPTVHHGRFGPADSVRHTVKLAKALDTHIVATEKGVIDNALAPIFDLVMQEEQWYLQFSKLARTSNKATHAHSLRGRFELGQMHLPSGTFFETVLKPQLLQFSPDADGDDDLVDMLSNGAQAIDSEVCKPPPPPIPEAPPEDDRMTWEWIERRNSLAGIGESPRMTRLNGDPYPERTDE